MVYRDLLLLVCLDVSHWYPTAEWCHSEDNTKTATSILNKRGGKSFWDHKMVKACEMAADCIEGDLRGLKQPAKKSVHKKRRERKSGERERVVRERDC